MSECRKCSHMLRGHIVKITTSRSWLMLQHLARSPQRIKPCKLIKFGPWIGGSILPVLVGFSSSRSHRLHRNALVNNTPDVIKLLFVQHVRYKQSPFQASYFTRRPSLKHFSGSFTAPLSLWMGKHQRFNFIFEIMNEIWQQLSVTLYFKVSVWSNNYKLHVLTTG